MSLSDYMPYGAPELLEGAAPRMARSTMIATGFVAAMVWLAGLLASGQRTLAIPEIPPQPPIPLLDEPNVILPRTPDLIRVRPSPPVDATPRPVPDVPVLEPATIVPALTDAPTSGPTGEPEGPGRLRPGNATPIREPGINDVVIVDELPQPVRCAEPLYPDLARDAGVEGTVHVRMLLGLDGHVVRAVLEPGSRTTMLDEAALAAARTCVFTPALADKNPVMVWVAQAYRFRLH